MATRYTIETMPKPYRDEWTRYKTGKPLQIEEACQLGAEWLRNYPGDAVRLVRIDTEE